MVDAITGFVVGKIGIYLIEEASTLMGVKDELEELKTELTCIQGYLKDVEAQEREYEVSKEWTKLVLDIAYDVEDVLDTYILNMEKRSQRRGLMRLASKIGEKMDAYSIVDDIGTLKKRILDITRKRETYGIGNVNEPQGIGSGSSLRIRELRRCRSSDQDERVVGLANDYEILLAKLLDHTEKKRYMISIFGMGGLGKTALARKLYNSSNVKTRFGYRAWTYVSQDYKTRDMLMRIIRSLGVASTEELEKIRMFAEEELEVYLHGLLEGKRYLVVVDDIWEPDAWESLKRALPCNEQGSRVIVTTRIRAIAEGVDQRVYPHELSWSKLRQDLLINLRDLEIYDQSSTWVHQRRAPLGLASFSKLKNLRVLRLEVKVFKLSTEFEEAVRFQNLVELTLQCHIRKLPQDMDMIFPSLELLRLQGSNLEEDPMPALQKLQRLEDLSLKNCDYGAGAKMSVSAQGFCQLRKLELNVGRLDELQIEEEALPNLIELNMKTHERATKLIIPDRLRAFVRGYTSPTISKG